MILDFISSRSRRPRRPQEVRPQPFRPALETLESRLVPAVAVGLSAAPGADGGVAASRVVFFEPSVADYRTLAQGLLPGAQAVVLDGTADGLDQMAAYLGSRRGLGAVEVVSHGAAGVLSLGAAVLDGAALASHAADLRAIGQALAPGGELDLWSCDVAAGPQGQALLDGLAAATGAGVAASARPVGEAELGGTWDLGSRVGGATAADPFTAGASEAFHGLLDLWTSAAGMITARNGQSAALLPNGKVLVVGGAGSDPWVPSAELYDPASDTWFPAADAGDARDEATATVLADGKVLLVGGFDPRSGAVLSSAQLYDPASDSWPPAGNMSVARYGDTATLLADGRVLVTGGDSSGTVVAPMASAELYDPASNSWSPAASMTVARSGHTATLLPDGRVLVAGGSTGNAFPVASAELYDPASNSWSAAAGMTTARAGQTATLLPGGAVLVAGGAFGNHVEPSAELYNPASNSWSPAGNLAVGRDGQTATLLPGGKVLVVGGSSSSLFALSSAELYDPASNSWSPAAGMRTARSGASATLLPNGRVLVAGGVDENGHPLASAELYTPDPPVTISGRTMTVLGTPGDDTFTFQAGPDEQYTLNGTSYPVDASAIDTVVFYGDGGSDTATLIAPAGGGNRTSLAPGGGILAGAGYTVSVGGVTQLVVDGGPGDRATLLDSPGDDRFVATPTYAYLQGSGYLSFVSGVGSVTAAATAGGNDTAELYDSRGDDLFLATPDYAALSGPGYANSASGFKEVQAFSTSGNDLAYLYGSPGDDTFVATPDFAYLTAGYYLNVTVGFRQVWAYGGDVGSAPSSNYGYAGNDHAELYESSGFADFTGTSTTSSLYGLGYARIVDGFRDVRVYSAGGGGSANLQGTGSPADTYVNGGSYAYISDGAYLILEYNFTTVTANPNAKHG